MKFKISQLRMWRVVSTCHILIIGVCLIMPQQAFAGHHLRVHEQAKGFALYTGT